MIDEADRLLAQSFQDWLAQVLAATQPKSPADVQVPSSQLSDFSVPDALSPSFLHLLRGSPHVHTVLDEKKETSCQKLLFSATLTRDPSKIVALNLREPKYFIVQGSTRAHADNEESIVDVVMEKYTMPASLKVSGLPS